MGGVAEAGGKAAGCGGAGAVADGRRSSEADADGGTGSEAGRGLECAGSGGGGGGAGGGGGRGGLEASSCLGQEGRNPGAYSHARCVPGGMSGGVGRVFCGAAEPGNHGTAAVVAHLGRWIRKCVVPCAFAGRDRAAERAVAAGECVAAGGSDGVGGARLDGGREPGAAAGAGAGGTGGADGGADPGAGRVGHRQGAAGADDPRTQPAERGADDPRELRGDSAGAVRERVFRACEGLVHGSGEGSRGAFRAGGRRDAVPGRGGGDSAGAARQTAAGAAGGNL